MKSLHLLETTREVMYTVLTAYVQTLVNRYTLLDHMDREQDCRTELCVGDFKIDLMRRQVFL